MLHFPKLDALEDLNALKSPAPNSCACLTTHLTKKEEDVTLFEQEARQQSLMSNFESTTRTT